MLNIRSGWSFEPGDLSDKDKKLMLEAIAVVREETAINLVSQAIRDSEFVKSCVENPKAELTSLIEKIKSERDSYAENDPSKKDIQKRINFLEEALR